MYKKILNDILLSEKPSIGIYRLMKTKEMERIIPEIYMLQGFEQKTPYHNKDVLEHTMAVLDAIESKLNLRMAALLHDISKPVCFTIDENGRGHFYGHHIKSSEDSERILKRLKYSDEFILDVKILIRHHYIKDIVNVMEEKGIKEFIESVGENRLNDMFELIRADMVGKAVTNFDIIEKLKNKCKKHMG